MAINKIKHIIAILQAHHLHAGNTPYMFYNYGKLGFYLSISNIIFISIIIIIIITYEKDQYKC